MEEEGEREENIVRVFSEELLECCWCTELQIEFHFLQRSETGTEFWYPKKGNKIIAKEKVSFGVHLLMLGHIYIGNYEVY